VNNQDQPLPPRRIALYATLQTLTLLGCWLWFGILWTIAFFSFTLENIEWWLLVAAACAGVYGLRPNLERAIDTAWLQGVKTSGALAARAAQLKPIKRRIDISFSIVVLTLAAIGLAVWAMFLAPGGLSGTIFS
jgi:hypothetical protein